MTKSSSLGYKILSYCFYSPHVVADFAAVYLFTKQVDIALGFVVVSNIYTSVLYLLHERFWDRVAWGRGVS